MLRAVVQAMAPVLLRTCSPIRLPIASSV